MLWEWNTDLRFFSWHRPILGGGAAFTTGNEKFTALADTRILLNVHRSDEPYFEWARVVEAIANGCVVASETSVGIEPLVPGVHFLMAPLEHLAEQAIALAFDEPRRAAMADEAYKLTTTSLSQGDLLQAALVEASALPNERRAAMPRQSARRPKRSSNEPQSPISHELRKAASELKAAYIAQLQLSRSIEGTISLVEHGDPEHAEVISTSTWESFEPQVSVVIPLYNQGHYLAEAVQSVIGAGGSAGPRTELIIVDDHSTDQSRSMAEQLFVDIDWFPAMLVVEPPTADCPSPATPGCPVEGAIRVCPRCRQLVVSDGFAPVLEHLESAPADVVAAFGILERFDTTGSLGLTSHLPWDPDLLVHGAFIDATAMFRRSSWLELGGDRPPTGCMAGRITTCG